MTNSHILTFPTGALIAPKKRPVPGERKQKSSTPYQHQTPGRWIFRPDTTTHRMMELAHIFGIERFPDLEGFTMKQVEAGLSIREKQLEFLATAMEEFTYDWGDIVKRRLQRLRFRNLCRGVVRTLETIY